MKVTIIPLLLLFRRANAICDDLYAYDFPNAAASLSCEPFPGDPTLHAIVYGCNAVNQNMLAPATVLSQSFNQLCTAQASTTTNFVCYELADGSDLSAFQASAESSGITCASGDSLPTPMYLFQQTNATSVAGTSRQNTAVAVGSALTPNLVGQAYFKSTGDIPIAAAPTEAPGPSTPGIPINSIKNLKCNELGYDYAFGWKTPDPGCSDANEPFTGGYLVYEPPAGQVELSCNANDITGTYTLDCKHPEGNQFQSFDILTTTDVGCYVKGGNVGGYLYELTGGTQYTDLQTPSGQAISHVTFCFKCPGVGATPAPIASPTSTPETPAPTASPTPKPTNPSTEPEPEFQTCSDQEIMTGNCPDLCQCPCTAESGAGVFVMDASYGMYMQCMGVLEAYQQTVVSESMSCVDTCPEPTDAPTESLLTEEEESSGCETAFAYDENTGTCFSAYDMSRWGWTIGPLSPGDTHHYDIYAGAGKCDILKGYKVGFLEFGWDVDGSGYVTYTADEYFKFEETHFYLGKNPLPKDENGNDTVAPGQYSVVHDVCEDSKVDHITFSASMDELYIIAHAVSCDDW